LTQPVVYLQNRFVTPAEAVVPLADRGYLLGEGVFATMRGYDGVCFRPAAHLRELTRGASMLGIPCPSIAELTVIANEAARRTGEASAYVRVTLTAGPPDGPPTLSILARKMDLPSDAEYALGVAAITVRARRIPPSCFDGTIKTTSYVTQVLARRECETGIQLSVDGALACGTMSNLFVVMGERLLTPSLESGCRAGVTRAAVLEIAAKVGLLPIETRLDASLLAGADEAFFTSTRIECLPIASIDGQPLRGSAKTHALRAALVALIREETSR
jgi:branched-chain amino acid aminotransferase